MSDGQRWTRKPIKELTFRDVAHGIADHVGKWGCFQTLIALLLLFWLIDKLNDLVH